MNKIIWRDNKGDPIACVEKIKIMQQNIDEISKDALDIYEDAILMGIDPCQIKDVLANIMLNLKSDIKTQW